MPGPVDHLAEANHSLNHLLAFYGPVARQALRVHHLRAARAPRRQIRAAMEQLWKDCAWAEAKRASGDLRVD